MAKRKAFKCVLCGCAVKGITVHDFKFDAQRTDVDWQLCPKDAIGWLLRRLTPYQVLKIRKLAGGETFHTHSDFYNNNGKSLQPVLG